jgi:hypothetical protein
MSRPRWPDSHNSLSQDPGTLQFWAQPLCATAARPFRGLPLNGAPRLAPRAIMRRERERHVIRGVLGLRQPREMTVDLLVAACAIDPDRGFPQAQARDRHDLAQMAGRMTMPPRSQTRHGQAVGSHRSNVAANGSRRPGWTCAKCRTEDYTGDEFGRRNPSVQRRALTEHVTRVSCLSALACFLGGQWSTTTTRSPLPAHGVGSWRSANSARQTRTFGGFIADRVCGGS